MSNYYYFHVDGYDEPLGYVHKRFIYDVEWFSVDSINTAWVIDHTRSRLTLFPGGNDPDSRTRVMTSTLRAAHEYGEIDFFKDKPWTDDKYPIFTAAGEHVMDINACGVDIFGVIQYTVHLTAWMPDYYPIRYRDEEKMIWVPKWAAGPGECSDLFDSTVSGRLAPGEDPMGALLRLCEEQKILLEDPCYMEWNAYFAGTNSFQMWITDEGEEPVFHREVQYLFEIGIPIKQLPRNEQSKWFPFPPGALSLDGLKLNMGNRRIKPSSNMAYMAWLIRHGLLDPDNEPELAQITPHLNRRQDLFVV